MWEAIEFQEFFEEEFDDSAEEEEKEVKTVKVRFEPVASSFVDRDLTSLSLLLAARSST